MENLGSTEFVIFVVIVGLLILWAMGVIKLFQKNHTVLAWIAVAGIIFPPLGLIGFAGWFVEEKQFEG